MMFPPSFTGCPLGDVVDAASTEWVAAHYAPCRKAETSYHTPLVERVYRVLRAGGVIFTASALFERRQKSAVKADQLD